MQRPYGFALLINIRLFDGKTKEGHKLKERRGSHVDLENLTDLWAKLNFTVRKYENLKAHQMYSVLLDMVKEIEKTQNSSCFVCCIMTHGAMGTIYGSDSEAISIKDITDLFKESSCPALAGKPKLFFIQACRGNERLTGRDLRAEGTGSSNTATETTCATTQEPTQTPVPSIMSGLDSDATPAGGTAVTDEDQYNMMNDSEFRRNADPNEAHFLLGYSTAPGI